ncbi:MAG: glycoside hydrolase family 3 C-terminal domain-containing protein [Prevotella sp.]|nr:glycoside hydrolase family 3 C-terminal domain-containing protein [Prevotella sp.]
MKKHSITLLIGVIFTLTANAQDYPYQNPNLSAAERAADLCSRLTLEEKTQLMRNASPAIPRLGIPQFEWWSEALHGVGRNGFATVFPITMGMAASFDDALLERVYTAVSDEARAKNNQARQLGFYKRYQGISFWTPNINIFRDPRWGRGQETYGEDPYLTSRMGLAVVRGLQGPADSRYRKLDACAKHYAVHSGPEWNRHTFNVEDLPERDLWETYLPAFKALVQEGNVAQIMCAYQRIDGDPCCGNTRYLQQILRQDWHFPGVVVSDCGAVSDFYRKGHHEVVNTRMEASSKAVLSGTDVECGSEYRSLPEAVKAGLISEEQIDVSVRRLLQHRFELGDFDDESLVPWKRIGPEVIASAEHKQLALDIARESIVLLQNRNNLLPLKKDMHIAVMGPNANDSVMMWGNYYGYPTATITLLKGIQAKAKDVTYVRGCGYTRNEALESRFQEITGDDGTPGMKATYWNNMDMEGTPVATMQMREPISLSNGGATVFAPGVELERFSARYTGTFRPTRDEKVVFSVGSDDKARVIVNGDTIINNWQGRERVVIANKEYKVKAGGVYDIVLEYVQETGAAQLKFDVGCVVKAQEQDILRQVADADVVVFVGGISPALEGEEMKVNEPGFKGGDRTDIELPQAQRDIIALLHHAGKRVVFINCSGGAIAMVPETENAEAIIQAWYGGEHGGTAVAEVLFGDYNPSGKLPVTFYRSTDDLPDFLDYTMNNRTYRYFKGKPLFPFGHGLSYTTFAYGKPTYKNGRLTFTLTNTGQREGTETVQVYIRRIADITGPQKSLRAFSRVTLKAGERRTVSIDLPRERFESWDAQTNTMRVIPGQYDIMTGGTSDASGQVTVKANIKP